jgi:hypothetical protein
MDVKQRRSITINMGAVKRLVKEKASYETELATAQMNLDSSTFTPRSFEHQQLQRLRDEAQSTLHAVDRRLNDFKGRLRAVLASIGGEFSVDLFAIEANSLLTQ